MAMDVIVVRPKYPRDVKPAELDSLAAELRSELASQGLEVNVRVDDGDNDHRVGVTFIECVEIALTAVSALDIVSIRAAGWLKRRRDVKQDHRPRSVSIFGPDGKVVRRVELDADEAEARVIDVPKK